MAVYHLTNLYFARQRRLRAPSSCWRDGGVYPAAVLGRLRAARLASLPLRAAVPPARAPARAACWRPRCWWSLGAFALAVRLHHRRPGVPAGDLPRLRGEQQLRRRRRSRATCRAWPELLLGLGGARRGLRADRRRRARARLPAAGRPRAARPGAEAAPMHRLLVSAAHKSSGKTTRRARPGRGAARRAALRGAAVQEGPGLHRPDVAGARPPAAPCLNLDPHLIGRRGDRAALRRAGRAAPTSRWSKATRACTTAWRWTAATATPRWRSLLGLPVLLVHRRARHDARHRAADPRLPGLRPRRSASPA
ncbi:MAG: hypothetical protein MZV65_33110 [Chromatiales bacterium]|nr:hypothetical protein [Chromatiales bacterium]